ncbi:hypothetical protein C8Q76DRAFT_472017 [Earliella scabrosa]|nr:hypothetical protein C8Q76DRAFT_472017 [Earliella scabrosa]
MDLPRASTTCQDVEMAAPQDPAPVPSQTSDIHSMTAPTHGSTPPPTAPLQITSIEPEQPYPVAVPVFLSGHRGLYPNHPFSLTYKFADGVLHSLPFTWNALFDHLPKSVEIKAGVVEDVGRRTSTVGAMPSPSPHDDPDSVAPHGCPHELAAELQRALNDSTEDSLTEAATPKTFAELASWFGAQGSLSVDVNKLRMGGCQHMSTDGLAW